jgi:DNA-directed RNA polymerase beta subunit
MTAEPEMPYDNPAVVGIEYVMKLIHMVEDKTHAQKSPGPYSLGNSAAFGRKSTNGRTAFGRNGSLGAWKLIEQGIPCRKC